MSAFLADLLKDGRKAPGTAAAWKTVNFIQRPPRRAPQANVQPLCHLADKYDMPAVLQRCAAFLMATPLSTDPGSPGAVVGTLRLAERYRLEAVRRRCVAFASENASQLLAASGNELAGSIEAVSLVEMLAALSATSDGQARRLRRIGEVLEAEGLAVDETHGRVCIRDFNRWMRMAEGASSSSVAAVREPLERRNSLPAAAAAAVRELVGGGITRRLSRKLSESIRIDLALGGGIDSGDVAGPSAVVYAAAASGTFSPNPWS